MGESQQDEQLLIDFVLGPGQGPAAEEVRARLAGDAEFAALHANISNTLAALGTCPAPEPPEDLAERTMARIRAARRTEMLLEAQPVGPSARRPLFSYRDLAVLAAVVVLAFGIMIPSLRQAQTKAYRTVCADNLQAIYTGLSHYANGNGDLLPRAPKGAGPWLAGQNAEPASNSAGLFLLVRKNYALPELFQCPAAGGRPFSVESRMNDFPDSRSIGYSYQHCITRPIRRSAPALVRVARQMAILADANPVFRDGRFERDRVHWTVSDNHGGQGQNVLYLDGNVEWATDCNVGVGGNNIWLAEGIYEYTGNEEPVSPTDSFLLPNGRR